MMASQVTSRQRGSASASDPRSSASLRTAARLREVALEQEGEPPVAEAPDRVSPLGKLEAA
jgi:hypothetical protein